MPQKKSNPLPESKPREDETDSTRAALATGQLYRTLLSTLPEAVVLVDAAGRIADWPQQAIEIFGWSATDAISRNLIETVFPATTTTSLRTLAAQAKALPEADPWIKLTARRRDGDNFPAAVRIKTTRLLGRSHYLFVIRDIADELLAEQQLVQAQKLEALSHLTGGLAHDFNNILGIIIGSLELVAPGLPSGEDRELVDASLAAAQRGAEITRSLLAVARRRTVNPQVTNINRLIAEIAPLLQQTAGKAIEVTFSADARDADCMIDPGGLNNALVNLVINARDAMPEGGRIVVYAYTTRILPKSLTAPLELKAGEYVVIGVDDEGKGMTPEVAMRAFDPFFTTKERGKGTGLGLAMVYGFARQSGGTARIQSSPELGTSVQLILPTMNARTPSSTTG